MHPSPSPAPSGKMMFLELGGLIAYWIASDFFSARTVALLTLLLCVVSAGAMFRRGQRPDALWMFGNGTALVLSVQEWLQPDWPTDVFSNLLFGVMLLWCGFNLRSVIGAIQRAQQGAPSQLNLEAALPVLRRYAFVWAGYFLVLALLDLAFWVFMGHERAVSWAEWTGGVSLAVMLILSFLAPRLLRPYFRRINRQTRS